MPNPRAAFQDKVVGAGWGETVRGRGRKEGSIRTAAMWGGNQPGHGGGPGSPAPRSRWRPRASGSPRLLGLCSASNGSESAGGCFQSPLAGAGAGDHLATCCHHVRLRLSLPLPGKLVPLGVCVCGRVVSEPQCPHLGCFLMGRMWPILMSFIRSFCALRHPLARRICGTQASLPCWSLDSYCLCRCSCLPWLPTAASAFASAWSTASCPTAEPSTGAGASHSRSKSRSHQAPGLFQHRERSGSEVLKSRESCRLLSWSLKDLKEAHGCTA